MSQARGSRRQKLLAGWERLEFTANGGAESGRRKRATRFWKRPVVAPGIRPYPETDNPDIEPNVREVSSSTAWMPDARYNRTGGMDFGLGLSDENMDEPTRVTGSSVPRPTRGAGSNPPDRAAAGNSGEEAHASGGGIDETVASSRPMVDATHMSEGLPRGRTSRSGAAPKSLGGFEIEREISRGGQGVVYRAFQPGTNRPIALKLMLGGEYATEAALLRFQREIETTGSLKHPNIVTVYSAEIVGDQPVLAMEWIDGVPAHEWCVPRRVSASGIRQIIDLFLKICDAIHYAHQRGVIHRDLKPNNVLVDASGEPHLLDFGLAKLTKPDMQRPAITVSEEFLGTPAYAAPEQLMSDAGLIDVRTDEYALALMLCQMLTGALPYDIGESFGELIKAIEGADPSAASRKNALVDDDVDAILQKALSKDKESRYPSVDAMAADLRRYVRGEPIEAKRDRAMYVLRKTLRRHRTAVRVAGMIVVMLIAFGVTMFLLYQRALGAEEEARKRLAETEAAKEAEERARIVAQSEAANARFRLEATRKEASLAHAEFARVAQRSKLADEYENRLAEAERADFPTEVIDGNAGEVTGLFPEWWGEAEDAGPEAAPEPVSLEVRRGLETHVFFPGEAANEPLYEWLRDHAERIDQLDRLTRAKRIDWPHRQTGPLLFQNVVPRLNDARLMVEILSADAYRLWREGSAARAVGRLSAARRITRYAGDQPTLFHALVSLSSRLHVYAMARWMAVERAGRGERPRELLEWMRDDAPVARLEWVLAAEARGMRQAATDSFVRRKSGAAPVVELEALKPFLALTGDDGATQLELRKFTNGARFDEVMAGVSDVTRMWAEAQDEDFAGIAAVERRFRDRVREDALLSALAFNWRTALELRRAVVMSREATRVALAVCEARVREGKWPGDIGAMKKAVDAFGAGHGAREGGWNEWMRYSATEEGPSIHADGVDLRDDGGCLWGEVQTPFAGADFVYVATPSRAALHLKRRLARWWADAGAVGGVEPGAEEATERAAVMYEELARGPCGVAADWVALGRLRESTRREEAEAAYEVAMRLDPALDEAWLEQARLMRRAGRFTESVELLERGTKEGGGPARTAALCLMMCARPDAEKRDARRAREIAAEAIGAAKRGESRDESMIAALRSVLALAELRSGNHAGAVEALTTTAGGVRAVLMDARLTARDHAVLAIGLLKLGESADAMEQWRQAKQEASGILRVAALAERNFELPELMRECEAAFSGVAE